MRNLFIKGLPMGFWEEDIGRLVAALGCVVTSSMVWRDKKGKSRGVALVEVETEEQAAELTQVLRLRTIFRRPQGAGDLVAQAGAGGQQVPAGVPLVVGEGESAWEVAAVPEGDRSALIVESAFREASHVRGPDEPRRPRKEDPQEKQKRCEVLRRARLAARRAELEAGVPEEERDSILTLDKVRRMRKKMSNDLLAAATAVHMRACDSARCSAELQAPHHCMAASKGIWTLIEYWWSHHGGFPAAAIACACGGLAGRRRSTYGRARARPRRNLCALPFK